MAIFVKVDEEMFLPYETLAEGELAVKGYFADCHI